MPETYIPMPEGFEIPQGANQGEEFDVTVRVKPEEGKLCVLKINGIPVKGGEEEEEEEEDDDEMPVMGKGLMEAARKDGYA
jgi:hypothetical protein